MKILVVKALELSVAWPLHWVVEHGPVTPLHRLVLAQWPRQDSNVAVHAARLVCGGRRRRRV